MSGTDEYYVPGGELPFARIRGKDNPESDGLDTLPETGTGLALPFNQSEESLESLYHESQTGVEEGRVSAAAALEQAERERATNQAYLYSKANKGILARNRERRDGHAAQLVGRKAATEADSLSSTTERPQPAAGGSGTFTVPAEPVEEDDMSFNDIFGAGPTTTAPEAPAKKPLTGGKIRPKDHPHVKLDSANLQNFLERYEKAAEMEGVGNRGMAMQIGNFVESNKDLVDIEEMEGYKAEDWEELKKEMIAKAGGISTVEVYQEYTAAFDRVLRYLNKNEIVIGTSGTVKRYYLRAFKESDREKIHRQLLIKGLIATAVDGRVTALPEMDVIREAITAGAYDEGRRICARQNGTGASRNRAEECGTSNAGRPLGTNGADAGHAAIHASNSDLRTFPSTGPRCGDFTIPIELTITHQDFIFS
ncbi:hypothetical protein Pst134EA_005404 [Puccinia striiformis f. sp. tritici]|uniref:hypothetical protein n=1 Tax=Puccinia striiformis f. sp. tritici TaxID=168172 RepID=UPI0020082C89|nr:hypothetical protein Pst134EA_005404 [Puccinia striiformis f. sp. tritici]KAH9471509.1 hypothetical protein Pst134EA_005404 [Puccinia striiformis f. sp. tritici]